MDRVTVAWDSASGSWKRAAEFTRGDAFGLFLTLAVCLLSQPYGSLLYRRTCGRLWRLSPLACLAEAALITLGLARAVAADVWRGGLLRSRRRWRASLRATAAAMLALRSCVDDDAQTEQCRLFVWDGHPPGDQPTGLLTGAEEEERKKASGGAAAPPEKQAGGDPGKAAYKAADEKGKLMESSTEEKESGQGDAPPADPPRYSDLERGPGGGKVSSWDEEHREADDAYIAQKREQLVGALGLRVYAHRESSIGLIGQLAMLGALAVLAATRSTWGIKVAAALMAWSWLSVQALLLLLFGLARGPAPSFVLDDALVLDARLAARALDRSLNTEGPTCRTIYTLCSGAGLYVYLQYAARGPAAPPQLALRLADLSLLALALAVALSCFLMACCAVAAGPRRRRELELAAKTDETVVTLPLWWSLFGWVLSAGAAAGLVLFLNYGALARLAPEGGWLYEVLGEWKFVWASVVCGLLPCCMMMPSSIMGGEPLPRSFQRFFLGVNFYITAVVFVWCLAAYDVKGSYKPAWLSWLG